MQGPEFLVAYATLWVAFFVICLIVRYKTDRGNSQTPVNPEADPDPYKIAYLRGGSNEVFRLATFELYSQGLLQETKPKLGAVQWQRIPGVELPETLSPFAKQAAIFYSETQTPIKIFRSNLAGQFVSEFDRWDEWIAQQGLRVAPAQQFVLNLFGMGSALIFFGAGMTKITSASLRHIDNIGFAVVMMFLGSLLLFLTRSHRRFNARGRKYLSEVQLMNAEYRDAMKGFSEESSSNASAAGGDQQGRLIPLMAVGIFGVAALNGSPFQDFRTTYLRSESTGGGCGAGCGGASCGAGTSCGGGGGGCGGGGCGGCGGGCGG